VDLRQWKKGTFQGHFTGGVFREHEVHTQGNIMQVFSSFVTSHRSRNESSKVQKRSNRDGDKLLCNRCPLKHEAREREG